MSSSQSNRTVIDRSADIDNRTASSNSTLEPDDYIPYPHRLETYLVPAAFSIVFVFGILGNGTLIYIFLRQRSVRTSSNVHILSLAIGDFLVIVGTVPFVSIIYILDSWPFGKIICKGSEFLRDLSVAVTALSLTALSVERYVAISKPTNRLTMHRFKTTSVISAVAIWITSFCVSIPGAYYSYVWEVPVSEYKTINVCYPFPQDMWPWYPRLMVMLKFFLFYAIPLCVITSFYTMIAYNLVNSFKADDTEVNRRKIRTVKSRWKAAKLVLLLVVIFAFCFLPGHLFMLWFYFYPNSTALYNEFWHALKIIGYLLSFIGSCANPVALYFINVQFRGYFQKFLFRCCFST